MLMIDNSAQTALLRELTAGEHLLWTGMPRQGMLFRAGDVILVPFSLLWGGFAFFWEYNVVILNKAPFFFMLWGIPFVLIGIYLIAGRFFVDSYQRSRTYYGVTDQRVLILSGISARQVKAISLQNLNETSLTERSDGSGDIAFGSMGPKYKAPTFELIDNVREVYNLIEKSKFKK